MTYLEKLIVGGFGLQLLAVGDCCLEFGGLGDHVCGLSFLIEGLFLLSL